MLFTACSKQNDLLLTGRDDGHQSAALTSLGHASTSSTVLPAVWQPLMLRVVKASQTASTRPSRTGLACPIPPTPPYDVYPKELTIEGWSARAILGKTGTRITDYLP